MEQDLIIYLILAIGMVGLWLYHRQRSSDEVKRPRNHFVIILGIVFVIGFLYILKQAGMLGDDL